MKNVHITDITLSQGAESYSFREKIDIAAELARTGVSTVEVAPIKSPKSDVLFLHTIAPMMGDTAIACPVEWNDTSVETTWGALKTASRARLQVSVYTSPVGMEYQSHMKPKKILEMLPTVVAKCRSLTSEVEFVAKDATRAEPEFLAKLLSIAIENGANVITLCDSAGIMLPNEMGDFVRTVRAAIPQLEKCTLSVECSEELGLGTACAVAAVEAGADEIRCAVTGVNVTSLTAFAYLLKQKGDAMGIGSALEQTAIAHIAAEICKMVAGKENGSVIHTVEKVGDAAEFTLSAEDDCNTVAEYIRKLGYTLSDEDLRVVYESFSTQAAKKPIGARELEAIIATTAMQVIPTYTVKSYLANSGNTISSTAHIVLEKDGTECHGISLGDGPIDAAFRAIEQLTGHHFELDDFQIRAVTEGREAMGEAVVKLRSEGKLYSGCGVSTDIIGASVHAYVNALNKICHEEAERA